MKLRYIYFLLILGVSVFSCKKDLEEFVPNNDTGLVENLIKKINNNTQAFVFNSNEAEVIVGKDGLVLEFDAETFVTKDEELYEGSVKVKVIESNKLSSLASIPGTTSVDGELFSATSLLKINFEDLEGNDLMPIKNYVVRHPLDKSQAYGFRMFVVNQQRNNNDWVEISDAKNKNDLKYESWEIDTNVGPIFGEGYTYSSSFTGWIAVGEFRNIDGVSGKEFCVDLPKLFNSDNTKVYFVFKDYISIVDLQSSKQNTFCEELLKPKSGEETIVFSLSATEDGEYYLDARMNPDLDENIVLNPEKMKIEEIVAFLQAN